jgi:hypothetical protein
MKAKRSENFILQFNIATWHELAAMEIHTDVEPEVEKAHLRPDCLQLYWKFLREWKSWPRLMLGFSRRSMPQKNVISSNFSSLFADANFLRCAPANGKSFNTFIYHQKWSICE